MLKRFFILFALFLTPYSLLLAQVTERSLNNLDWKFRRVGDSVWYKATVPGTVHTDLFSNHLIPDPFYGDNEKKLQWIDTCDWEYKAEFNISEEELKQAHIEIDFKGLDTYAKVYVNDSLVIDADNMFLDWNKDIKKFLHNGENSLRVDFSSALKMDKMLESKLPYTLPGGDAVFTRKAQYQYGWDFAPRFITCGIWKDVFLKYPNDDKIAFITFKVDSLTDSIAEVDFKFLLWFKYDTIEHYVGVLFGEKNSQEKIVKVPQGENVQNVELTILSPKKWWCNGLGDPYLYKVKTYLLNKTKEKIDSQEFKIGLKTIHLVLDSDKNGQSFYFKLNGIPVFIKGANYISPDMFLPSVSKGKYDSLVDLAAAVNMNMLRVWGGGVYPDDEFYKECDKKGILVWQDFMFACGVYPFMDWQFNHNASDETAKTFLKLQKHSSLSLWCGNNEIDEGWYNWDWQSQYKYDFLDSMDIWQGNEDFFHMDLDFEISDWNDDYLKTHYIPTSPQIGWGHEEAMRYGDSHYWGVWWGMEPFEVYNKKVPRFMSEYGFQSLPDISTLSRITDTLSLSSIKLRNHQKHPTGFETINEYMKRDFVVPAKFENYAYVSQLLQAECMQIAIEAHRRNKPYCMGTLYWQFNDCWPAISWSSIDYYGTPKACYYRVKELYDNILISVIKENDKFNIYIVSDSLKALSGNLEIKLLNFDGEVLQSKWIEINVPANSSAIYYTLDKDFLDKIDTPKTVLECTFLGRKKLYYFCKPKNLSLVNPGISFTMIQDKVILTSKNMAKNVYLHLNGYQFRDNYFDLLPGESKTISYFPVNDGNVYTRNPLEILTLFDVMNEH